MINVKPKKSGIKYGKVEDSENPLLIRERILKKHLGTVGMTLDEFEGLSVQDQEKIEDTIYFNCSKSRKKQLLKKLNYKIIKYPKLNQ